MRNPSDRPFVVLKFGGTSVADAAHWPTIAAAARAHLPRARVIVVLSALAGVTDALERALTAASSGETGQAAMSAELAQIRAHHAALARELGLDAIEIEAIGAVFAEVARWLSGVALTLEATPRVRARVLASGELASSQLARAVLARAGLAVTRADARGLLVSSVRPREPDERRFLAASVAPLQDRAAVVAWADAADPGSDVIVTQGFIARTEGGETCLLGRGGSDTSAALIAARADADALEIWTDVPGLFTADPRQVREARLIERIGYREARELASLGAKVLHPPCLDPVARYAIPTSLRCTPHPEWPTTLIEATKEEHPAVTAVTGRSGTTLLTLSTVAMWDTSGFLARAFAPFEELGISIDLVGTSEAAISLTLDRVPGGVDGAPFAALLSRLREMGEVRVIHPCAVVSIVGRRIRSVLPEIGSALAAFAEQRIHLMSNSSEDLNLAFVVDEEHGSTLVQRLHSRLFSEGARASTSDPRFGPSWAALQRRLVETAGSTGRAEIEDEGAGAPWWVSSRARLLDLSQDGAARYVYHVPTVRQRARQLRAALPSVGKFYFAMKANGHPALLRAIAEEGFGLECVSLPEVRRAREVAGAMAPLLFTPNFCPLEEYRAALETGAEVTIDGPHLLDAAPELFRGVELALRVDPGFGLGHHEKVKTGGARSKFGHPIEEFAAVIDRAAALGTRIRGLHAHIGSGVLDAAAWPAVGRALATLVERAGPDLRWIDLGGGLGVPERQGQAALDLAAMERGLAPLAQILSAQGVELRLEPGRFLVSEAGVLLAPVTQVRRKGETLFVGLATGMNSLIRPALYGAWHPILNLSRFGERADTAAQIVGPICESGDVLGRDRWIAAPSVGDVMLIAFAGAYGAVMASSYNLRAPAAETVLDS